MFDEEIEKAILYYIIIEKEEFDLSEKDFVNAVHIKIINAINNLKAQRKEISLLTVQDQINNKNIQILKYMTEMGNYIYKTTPQTAFELLKKYTKQREIFAIAKEIQQKVKEEENIDIYIEKIINKLQKIEFQTQQEDEFVQSVSKTANLIEKKINQKKDYSFYTGFFNLDALTDGLHDGELTIVGARPRSRKNNVFFTNSR